MTPQNDLINIGQTSLRNAITALTATMATLGDSFTRAVEMILHCRGKVILTGMGKSGHVARKIAATLTSTGTPAIFLHAAEAAHGDLGIIRAEDIVVALSYSGETAEVCTVVEYAKRNGNAVIAITGSEASHIATTSDIHLSVVVEEEDCVLNLVPTTSTIVQMAIGDALAEALIYARNFHTEDFAHLHPGGHIEQRIATTKTNK